MEREGDLGRSEDMRARLLALQNRFSAERKTNDRIIASDGWRGGAQRYQHRKHAVKERESHHRERGKESRKRELVRKSPAAPSKKR